MRMVVSPEEAVFWEAAALSDVLASAVVEAPALSEKYLFILLCIYGNNLSILKYNPKSIWQIPDHRVTHQLQERAKIKTDNEIKMQNRVRIIKYVLDQRHVSRQTLVFGSMIPGMEIPTPTTLSGAMS